MYYNQFFKVSAKFHNVDLEGKEAKCSETFLIEALNFAEAYTAVLDLITKTTTFPDTIEIQKIEQAKFEELVVTDSMENENCINNNYVELFADHEIGIFVYDVKIAFETEDSKGKKKETTSTYIITGKSPVEVSNIIGALLKDSTVSYRISNIKATKTNTVLVIPETYKSIKDKYEVIKTYIVK